MSMLIDTIRWRNGHRSKVDPNIAYAEFERIRKQYGELDPDVILKEASDKTNPLHSEIYSLDDGDAAIEHRKEIIRGMIRSIEVVRIEMPKTPMRVYEVIRKPTEAKPQRNVYTTTEEVLADPMARADLLRNAINDAIAYRRKYSALQELSKVIAAVDEVLLSKVV